MADHCSGNFTLEPKHNLETPAKQKFESVDFNQVNACTPAALSYQAEGFEAEKEKGWGDNTEEKST